VEACKTFRSTVLLMDNFLRHALITETSDRVLKYIGHPVKKDILETVG